VDSLILPKTVGGGLRALFLIFSVDKLDSLC
jgi:hypothetical protein